MKKRDAEALRDHLLETLPEEDAMLLRVIEAIPEDKLQWKPDAPKTRTAAEMALHSATAAVYFMNVVAGKRMDKGMPAQPADRAGLVAAIRKIQKSYLKKLKSMDREELAAKVEFMGEKQPAITLLGWHVGHMIHHRAQLALYLRLMGAKVPSTYGPSGDEEMTATPPVETPAEAKR